MKLTCKEKISIGDLIFKLPVDYVLKPDNEFPYKE